MVDKFDDNLHYKAGDMYTSDSNVYEITGHKPCSECYLSRLDKCEGKAIFTQVKSKCSYDVCGIRKMSDGIFEKMYKKVEMTNIRW